MFEMRYLKTWRRGIQLFMIALIGEWSFYGIFRCPFPVPFISCTNCPVITCPGRLSNLFWGTWGLILLSGLLFGRIFCSWACPGGLSCQLIGKVLPQKVPRHRDIRLMHVGKYVALAIVLYLWLVTDNPRWAIPIRIGEFFQSVELTFQHAGPYWLIRTLAVLIFLTIGLVLSSAWCRYACPTGGVLELFRAFSFFRVYRTAQCNDCGLCKNVCEMNTMPGEINCTNCTDCIPVCPVKAIKVGQVKETHQARS